MKVAGYVRQSPGKTDPDSLFAQNERIRRWVRDTGHELVAIFQDQRATSSAFERPGLRALLDVVRAGRVDAVVIASLASLSPDVVTQEIIIVDLKEAGATVIATEDTDVEILRNAAGDHTRMIVRDIVAKVNDYQDAYGLSASGEPSVEPAAPAGGTANPDTTDVVIELRANS
jgi:DNA invertase Pin-like site-specific DNA recombinase